MNAVNMINSVSCRLSSLAKGETATIGGVEVTCLKTNGKYATLAFGPFVHARVYVGEWNQCPEIRWAHSKDVFTIRSEADVLRLIACAPKNAFESDMVLLSGRDIHEFNVATGLRKGASKAAALATQEEAVEQAAILEAERREREAISMFSKDDYMKMLKGLKVAGRFLAKAETPVAEKTKEVVPFVRCADWKDVYSSAVEMKSVEDKHLDDGFTAFYASNKKNVSLNYEAIYVYFTDEEMTQGETVCVASFTAADVKKTGLKSGDFINDQISILKGKIFAKAKLNKGDEYTPTLSMGTGSTVIDKVQVPNAYSKGLDPVVRKELFNMYSTFLGCAVVGGIIEFEMFGKIVKASTVSFRKDGNGNLVSANLYLPTTSDNVGADDFIDAFNIRNRSFNINLGMIKDGETISKTINNTWLVSHKVVKEDVEFENGKTYTYNVRHQFFSRIGSKEQLLLAMISGAKYIAKDIKSQLEHMDSKPGLQMVVDSYLPYNHVLFSGMAIHEDYTLDLFLAHKDDANTMFKAREICTGRETKTWPVAMNRSASTNHKLFGVGAISYSGLDSMVAAYIKDGKVLSIYEPKKAISRTVLNPAFDKGISIGERRVAAIVHVTDLNGNPIDMDLEFARKNRLATAFAGGATFMSKELAQTIGAVRLISRSHAKGVGYHYNNKRINALIKNLDVDMIMPMFKSSIFGIAKSISAYDMDIAEFYNKVFGDVSYRKELNKDIENAIQSFEIDGLLYHVVVATEELFVTDFYSLQGYAWKQDVADIQERINSVVSKYNLEEVGTVSDEDLEAFALEFSDIDESVSASGEEGTNTEEVEGAAGSNSIEDSVIRHITKDWADGNMSYSLIAKLKELKDQGLVQDSYKPGYGGILVANQIQAQFGKDGLDKFLSYAMRNSSIVKYGALAVSTSAHVYSEAETVRILADIYDDVSYVGYGSLGEGNITRRDGSIEAKFNLLLNKLFNGSEKTGWAGLLNHKTHFVFEFRGYKFIFPNGSYWNKPEFVNISKDGVKNLFAGNFMSTFASLASMVKRYLSSIKREAIKLKVAKLTPTEHAEELRECKQMAFGRADLSYAKHLEVLEKEFGGKDLFKFVLPNARNLAVVYQLEDEYSIHVNDKRWAKAVEKHGCLGLIKFPVLMENNVRLVNAKRKSNMYYSNNAERQLNELIESRIVHIDPVMHILNQDDADGDRVSVFELKGLEDQVVFNLDDHKKSVSFSTQEKFLCEEMKSLCRPPMLDENTVSMYDCSEFEEAVRAVSTAKAMTGKHTNALIDYTVYLQGFLGKPIGGKTVTQELINNIVAAVGLSIQIDAVTNMKHDDDTPIYVENIYMMGSAKEGKKINPIDAWKKVLSRVDIDENNINHLAVLIGSNLSEMAQLSGLGALGSVSSGEFGSAKDYQFSSAKLNHKNIVRMNHKSFWASVHNSLYSSGVSGDPVIYTAQLSTVGRIAAFDPKIGFDFEHMGAAGAILAKARELCGKRFAIELAEAKALRSVAQEEDDSFDSI